ncbi:MAG: FAD-dependent monooxygenase [Polaromonas sp.]|uniref:FAD-dependent oxidoreductase n=1 Tax=Polaromonas sp. TaxID=1869339 RepID=UPI0017D3A65B|nr:FAD-dependent oxidoreductase [Polaromonas sp.]MBA3593720.1 FAD-dependent monooxygenase [Polaromonas sp.]
MLQTRPVPPARAAYAEAAFSNGYEFTEGTGYTLPEYPFVAPPELATGEVRRYPVVIVGGGITGLTLACALAQYGVEAVLLDEDNTVGVKGASSRGICYAQKTLEIFKRLGVYERIARKGVQWSVGRTFAGEDEVYSFDLRQQQTHSLSQQPPFINLQQFYVEGFLVEQIQALNAERPRIDLRWNNRITAFAQTSDFATLSITTPAGDYTLQAAHVIDCTGSRSPFRAWCGASVTAKKGDDRWCIADVRFKDAPPVERHTWIEAPFNNNRAVWQHLMADGVWRIDYQMAPNCNPAEVSREDVVRARLNAQFKRELGEGECDIVWVGPYAYRSECLDQLRHGRVFFAGDSAHVVSPFGARGGNSGVQDADNLAWKLAAALQGRASPHLLDSYHQERHEAAQQNVQVTNRTARFLRPADGAERLFRSAAVGLARQHLFARQLVNTGRMSVPNTYSRSPMCDKSGGVATQNVSFQWADGKPGEFTNLLQWAGSRLLLLVFGELTPTAAKRLQSLSPHASTVCVQVLAGGQHAVAVEHVIDHGGQLMATCRVPGHSGWALLRPDGYVAACGAHIDAMLVRAISNALGLQGERA